MNTVALPETAEALVQAVNDALSVTYLPNHYYDRRLGGWAGIDIVPDNQTTTHSDVTVRIVLHTELDPSVIRELVMRYRLSVLKPDGELAINSRDLCFMPYAGKETLKVSFTLPYLESDQGYTYRLVRRQF